MKRKIFVCLGALVFLFEACKKNKPETPGVPSPFSDAKIKSTTLNGGSLILEREYDAAGRIMKYRINGILREEYSYTSSMATEKDLNDAGIITGTYEYTLNTLGQAVSGRNPAAGNNRVYQYNNDGQLTKETYSGGGNTIETNYYYNSSKNLDSSNTFVNGSWVNSLSFEYDLTKISTTEGPNLGYTFLGNGSRNITRKMTEHNAGLPDIVTAITYEFDAQNRVVKRTFNDGVNPPRTGILTYY